MAKKIGKRRFLKLIDDALLLTECDICTAEDDLEILVGLRKKVKKSGKVSKNDIKELSMIYGDI